MGQDYDEQDGQAARGQPICTHRDDAEEPRFTLGRSAPEPGHPDDQAAPTVDINELHMYANSLEERYLEVMQRGLDNNDEARFYEDDDCSMRYEAKPLYVWLPCGFVAVFLFWLQHYIYLHHAAWGAPFGRLDGLVRLGLMLLGAYLAFCAWPWRRLAGETPEERARLQSARYSFIDRFWRKR